MRRAMLAFAVAAWLWPAAVGAVTAEDFVIKDAEDVVDVCSTPKDDPLYTAAINFCQGFVVGAFAYHRSLYSQPGQKEIVCLPEPRPSRMQGIEEFVVWAKAHPEYGRENPADVMFKFLEEKWPCKS